MPTKPQLIAMLLTVVKTFAFALLGIVVMFGDRVLDMTGADWKAAAAAGIAAVARLAFNALNPKYTAYGIGAAPTTPAARSGR